MGRRALLLALLCVGAASCSRLARCEMDKVRAEVLDYQERMQRLRKKRRRLDKHIAEFEDKVFTNQKAGVDLLRAVLVEEVRDYLAALRRVRVKSHLLRPHHREKIKALQSLAAAYETLMRAYPAEDFDAIRQGLAQRKRAQRRLARAELEIRRLVQKYRERR
jgi:hypothetical protein